MIAGLPHEPVEHWHESLKWLDENWESYFYWGLHISTDTDNTTQSDFSVDSEKFGYFESKDQSIVDWATAEGYNNLKGIGKQNNKLDNRILVWESEWSNFKEATEFANMYMDKYFMKQKLFNFDMTEHLSKFPHTELLEFTARQVYIEKNLNSLYIQAIDDYKAKKQEIYK